MLNFFISTIAFSLAAYVLNLYFKTHTLNGSRAHTLIVMTIATLVSIGAGWTVDQLDGEAELHKNDPTIMEVVKSGDPMQIAKILAGF